MADEHKRHTVKWAVFFDPHNEPAGIEDSAGQMIVKFNPYDPPALRRALVKNLLWVQGCIRCDAYPSSITPLKAK